jgi:hypothetical protein
MLIGVRLDQAPESALRDSENDANPQSTGFRSSRRGGDGDCFVDLVKRGSDADDELAAGDSRSNPEGSAFEKTNPEVVFQIGNLSAYLAGVLSDQPANPAKAAELGRKRRIPQRLKPRGLAEHISVDRSIERRLDRFLASVMNDLIGKPPYRRPRSRKVGTSIALLAHDITVREKMVPPIARFVPA